MEILAYFFGPIGVLLAVNLIFFAATARELTCGLWKGEFVKSTTERSVTIFDLYNYYLHIIIIKFQKNFFTTKN